jgi:hypothetical protein
VGFIEGKRQKDGKESPAGQQTRIWNNTFADCDAHAISISKGTRWASVRNNLIVNTGRLTGVGGHDFLDHVGIVVWPGATTDTIADNVIWTGSKTPVVYQEPGWDSNRKVTVAWFNGQDGSFHNVIRGNVSADPRLTRQYQPSAVLPVKQAGRRQCPE